VAADKAEPAGSDALVPKRGPVALLVLLQAQVVVLVALFQLLMRAKAPA
jgi:hypothetical protein